MTKVATHRHRLLKRVLCSLVLIALSGLSITVAKAANDSTTEPAWASPSVMSIREISQGFIQQDQSNLVSNVDCSLIRYRLVSSSIKQTGCFTATSYGLLDNDSGLTLFNGGNEAIPILPYTPHQILIAWPKAPVLVSLDPTSISGTFISLYTSPLSAMPNQRNLLGQIIAKQLIRPPDLPLVDQLGQRLIVNPESVAFSGGGSWLVVESLNGTFLRINLATLDVTTFAEGINIAGNPSLLKVQVAVTEDGRYVAVENDDTSTFKVYDLTHCSPNTSGPSLHTCQSYDYWPFLQHQISGLAHIRHVRFINGGLLSFENSISGYGYEFAPSASIGSLTNYIGLGDSYTSGEGAFDYLSGTDTTDNACHLSRNSYPLLLTSDLYGSNGGHSVACSGAVINDVGNMSDTYVGQVRGGLSFSKLQQTQPVLFKSIETNFIPGYTAQQRFVSQYQPMVMTVSVGGDDIGFGDILQRCVEPHISKHTSDDTCFNTYEDRLELQSLIDRTTSRLLVLYKQLMSGAPGSTLYVIGYPQIAVDTGSCALNVHLDKSELEFAQELIDRLNSAVRQASSDAGAHYVDISQALAGHRLCEVASYDVAVNGLTAGTAAGPFGLKILGKESYHPNALGQQLMEQAVLKQTRNLKPVTVTVTPPASDNEQSSLLNAPKSGRPVATLLPDHTITAPTANLGTTIQITIDGQRDGLEPNQPYVVSLDSVSGPVLGTLVSTSDANVSGQVTLPPTVNPGGHTIDITGEDENGDPIHVTQPVYVTNGDGDADDDGIPDILDDCPIIPNSGQDSDQDGIDDVCDPLIGAPPVSSGPTNSPNSSPTTSVKSSNSNSNQPPNTPASSSSNTTALPTVLEGSAVILAGNIDSSLRGTMVSVMTNEHVPVRPIAGLQSGATVAVLGETTANSSTILKGSPAAGARQSRPYLPLPKVVNWIPWLGLVISLLLLLLLCLGVHRLLERAHNRQALRV